MLIFPWLPYGLSKIMEPLGYLAILVSVLIAGTLIFGNRLLSHLPVTTVACSLLYLVFFCWREKVFMIALLLMIAPYSFNVTYARSFKWKTSLNKMLLFAFAF